MPFEGILDQPQICAGSHFGLDVAKKAYNNLPAAKK
jgi:hypothetical protein